MKFLLDQDVYEKTRRVLIGLGHDVVTASESGLSTAEDSDLLAAAARDGRVLVTRDRDFGRLVFQHGGGSGVVYLRIPPGVLEEVHRQIVEVLSAYDENTLQGAFVTVEPGRHRFRRAKR
jgi:predicted nuclease of predicted toxin-antitoxin system